jgi:hypothetical protein
MQPAVGSAVPLEVGIGLATTAWMAGAAAGWWAADLRVAGGADGQAQLITLTTSFALWPVLLLAGWRWASWQRRVATVALSRAAVADPRWQAEAHWAAGLQWWTPRQHLLELATVFGAPDVRLVRAWWVSWLGFRVAAYLVIWQLWAPARLTLPGWVSVMAMIVQLAAGGLAIALIASLSRAARTVQVTSPDRWFEPAPAPRTELLVELGVLFRLVTPGFVIGAFSILGAIVH